ncbi:MAG: hydroxymethylglutaryl-CoA reductase, partial [Vicinamibacterales bacterium]
MSDAPTTPDAADDRPAPLALVPRFMGQGYSEDQVRERRAWVERTCGVELPLVGSGAIPTEQMRGNIENPIGSVQMPLAVAGPLLVKGEHASGTFYVPFATTEGALVRSYERGMVLLSRAGGVDVRILADENLVCPTFLFDDVVAAAEFVRVLPTHFEQLKTLAESTTHHGRLLRVETRPSGRAVIVTFHYFTADAQGMNMIVKATDRAAEWLVANTAARGYRTFSGMSSEKRA